jgi:LPXTG-motif cell wall-anchored protein
MSGITDSWWFYIIGTIVLLGLIGLLIVMRNKKDED